MRRHIAASLLLLAIPVAAQKTIVSPIGYDKKEGSSNNTFPWYRIFHYMQVHDDLKNNPMLVKGQAHRRDGTLGNMNAAGPRTIEIALWLGEADYSKVTSTYASNWASKPTNAFPKGNLNLPDWVQKPAAAPAPFTLIIPYKTPVPYTGKLALAWEAVITQVGSQGVYPADAVSDPAWNQGAYKALGTGCLATGQTRAMRTSAYWYTFSSPSQRIRHNVYASYGAKNAPAAILIGFSNPNLPLPLCGGGKTLFTSGAVIISTTSDANGAFRTPSLYVPWNPAFAGMKTFTQAVSVDAGQKPIPVAISNGVEASVATMPGPGGAFCRIYSSGDPNALSGNLAKNYAVVTQFFK